MSFPSSIDSFSGFTSSHTLSQDNHASQHNSEQAGIVAVETKVGTGVSTPTNHTILKGNGTGSSAWSQVDISSADITGTLPVSNGGTGQTSSTGSGSVVLQNSPVINSPTGTWIQSVYPIGCIYTEITGVNPNTTFGFGTWVQFGQGQLLAGQKNADTNFGTVLGTGGATSHSHPLSSSGYAQGSGSNSGGNSFFDMAEITVPSFNANDRVSSAGVSAPSNRTTGIPLGGNTDSSTFLPPYITVYFWRRTA